MVGSGGFEPPTSSASERRSPTELRAYPRVTAMLQGRRHGCQGEDGSPKDVRQRLIDEDVTKPGEDRKPRLADHVRDGWEGLSQLDRVERERVHVGRARRLLQRDEGDVPVFRDAELDDQLALAPDTSIALGRAVSA